MNFKQYISGKENFYFSIMLIFSIFVYLFLFTSRIGIAYVISFAICILFMQGLMIGGIKQNAVKITERQFPDIYAKIQEYSNKLNIKKVPDAYLIQSGGLLNAFATRFCFRNFMVIYSDILELAYEQGEGAVNFIIAHELAHIQRGHLTKAKWIIPANIIPFLGWAYSRARETTCDNIASAIAPEAKTDGLMLLIAGKKLYKNVNLDALIDTAKYEGGFWVWFAEICSTHPNLVKRIINVRRRVGIF